jgi:hypothetical protein
VKPSRFAVPLRRLLSRPRKRRGGCGKPQPRQGVGALKGRGLEEPREPPGALETASRGSRTFERGCVIAPELLRRVRSYAECRSFGHAVFGQQVS